MRSKRIYDLSKVCAKVDNPVTCDILHKVYFIEPRTFEDNIPSRKFVATNKIIATEEYHKVWNNRMIRDVEVGEVVKTSMLKDHINEYKLVIQEPDSLEKGLWDFPKFDQVSIVSPGVIPVSDFGYKDETVCYYSDDKKDLEIVKELMNTELIGFLIMATSTHLMTLTPSRFRYVPKLDNLVAYLKEKGYKDINDEVYKYFELTPDEVSYIQTGDYDVSYYARRMKVTDLAKIEKSANNLESAISGFINVITTEYDKSNVDYGQLLRNTKTMISDKLNMIENFISSGEAADSVKEIANDAIENLRNASESIGSLLEKVNGHK